MLDRRAVFTLRDAVPYLINLLAAVAVSAAVYGGIRQDIVNIHEKISSIEHTIVREHAGRRLEIADTNRRVDRVLENQQTHKQ